MEHKEHEIVNRYKDILDIDFVNKSIEITHNTDLGKISKTTINNIAKWALNGQTNLEIARNLELSEKQFRTLCALCPVIVYVMQDSRELADVIIASSLMQRAIGGQVIHKRVPVKIGDYEDGRKIGEHIEYAVQEEELPPDSNLLRFIAENKFSEKFGKEKIGEDKEVTKVVNTLDGKQLEELSKMLTNKN